MIADETMKSVLKEVFERTAAAVQAGPFRGMTLIEESSWHGGNILQKLLGTYECELHQEIERIVAINPALVINIGCAEGYYAVGLALRLPQAVIHVFDKDPVALQICERTAKANRAEINLRLEAPPSTSALTTILRNESRAALFVDCEGCEKTLFEEVARDMLVMSTIIVECHDYIHCGITDSLQRKFEGTHEMKFISQGGRNPNADPLLQSYHEDVRWLAVSEGRPVPMHWLCAYPKV